MKVKLLKSTAPSGRCNLFTIVKYIAIGTALLMLHFYANMMHHKLEPTIAKVNSRLPEVMRGKNFNFLMGDNEKIEIEPEFERYIEELGLVNPGENGDPVIIPQNVSDEIKTKIQEMYDGNGFNAFVSNLISLNRKLPDTRSEECKNKVYTDLPRASIIIPFFNEEWSLLLRTVHAVLNRSPDYLIEEILLVDDDSDRVELLEKLEDHCKKYPKIKIIRSPSRQGIILTRMLGVVNAKGPVIVLLDSHVEVSPGWLEPVLDRFKYQNELLVTMWHLRLDKDTLKFNKDDEVEPHNFAGFRWNMDFSWVNIKEYEGNNPTPLWDPKPVPTIFGSMHAIRKDFFIKIGLLDPGFDIWGGEDIELAFRVWCCGGKVEFVPCSKASHMSKGHHVYSANSAGKGGYVWNTDRIAETWLDEYKKYYYRSRGDTKDRKYGDISQRIALREKLKCKPFKWFYENIYRNKSIPENLQDPPTTVAPIKQ